MRALQTREVVHDMRQPIATIAALVGAAEAQEGLSPEVCHSLRQIKEQARELSELCRRMLGGPAEPRLLAVDELVMAAVRRAEVAYGCPIEVATTAVRIFGDDVNLRRALGNLLENACRAAAAGPVRVSVREVGAEALVEVSDGGPGFGAGPPGSASLGLAIVEGIVRQHGGRVEISASDLGGATVTMVVPAVGHFHPARGSSRPLGAGAASFIVDVRETEQRCPA